MNGFLGIFLVTREAAGSIFALFQAAHRMLCVPEIGTMHIDDISCITWTRYRSSWAFKNYQVDKEV